MVDELSAYETGPDAPVRATAAAFDLVSSARTLVLVEGISDQIAVETAALVRDLDLAASGVVVVPIGGAHAIANTLADLRRRQVSASVCGLYDAAEEPYYVRGLEVRFDARFDAESKCDAERAALERLGFFACVEDLEDELLRAAGRELVERVLTDLGDRGSFTTLQKQPAWRGQPFDAQIRRFIANSYRKHRYAAALVTALGAGRLPRPLAGVLEHAAI